MRRHLTYANICATIALLLAVSGTSMAASTMIRGSHIKKRSIPANRVKRNVLGGLEVNESRLGTVPSATTATDALKLGGVPAVNATRTALYDPSSLTAKTLFTDPDLGIRISSDGDADADDSVTLTNTNAVGGNTVSVVHASGVNSIAPGAVLNLGSFDYDFSNLNHSTFTLRQGNPGHDAMVLIECTVPGGGSFGFRAICTYNRAG